jgi:AcrR family transcriptional regulator
MDAALRLFATEGYGHCSISMLADYAGISKGLMYNYFDSKEELLATIIEKGLNEMMDLFDPDHDGILKSEELIDFIRKVFGIMRSDQEFWILYFSVILQPKVKEHLKNKPITKYLEQYNSMMIDYFKRKGFEDPFLEMLTLSALIEGIGVLLIYAYPAMQIPDEILEKYENRIIDMYS